MRRRLQRLLAEHLEDHDGIRINPIYDPPGLLLIRNPELMAPFPNRSHWTRMRRTQRLASLKATQKDSRFDPRRCPKRRRFDFSMKPYDWLLIGTHGGRYVRSDIRTRCEPQLFPSRYFPRQFHITFRASPACRRAAQADRRHARRLSRTVTFPNLRRQGVSRRGAPQRGMPLLYAVERPGWMADMPAFG